jgi:hypothetical protein
MQTFLGIWGVSQSIDYTDIDNSGECVWVIDAENELPETFERRLKESFERALVI